MTERSRTSTLAGIVLRQRPFGEKDRLIVLYSRERGKLSAVAKGARQPRSKLAAISQPLLYGRFTIAKGRSLGILTQGVVEEAFTSLKRDLFRFAIATCAVELLERAVPEGGAGADTDPQGGDVFNLLLACLFDIQVSEDPELALRSFELQFLHLLGYLPALKRCSRCHGALSGGAGQTQRFPFSSHFGGALCHSCRSYDRGGLTVSLGTLRAMVALRSGDPLAVRRLNLTPQIAHEIRLALGDFIRYRLEIDLKSRHFLDQVRWMTRGQAVNKSSEEDSSGTG